MSYTKLLKKGNYDLSYQHYKDAYETYSTSPKGAMSLLRSAYEELVKHLLNDNGIIPIANMKNNLDKIQQLNLLLTLPSTSCSTCGYKKKDHEFNFSYTIYGLLSYYGSHTATVDEKLGNFLFSSTSALILLILLR